MNKNTKKITTLILAVATVVALASVIVYNYKNKTSLKFGHQKIDDSKIEQNAQDAVSAAVNADAALSEVRKNSNLLKILPSDIVFGDKNAPVLMIEYASLSCPHCASFTREAFEKIKTEYIDQGKVKFVYRDFPLNQPALSAAMFAFCAAEDNKNQLTEKYYTTIKALFKIQDSWAFDAKFNERLEAIAKLDGMSSERFNSCINDKKAQERILNSRMETAKSLQIKSTPTFFINDAISEGYVDYASLQKIIEKKLAESGK